MSTPIKCLINLLSSSMPSTRLVLTNTRQSHKRFVSAAEEAIQSKWYTYTVHWPNTWVHCTAAGGRNCRSLGQAYNCHCWDCITGPPDEDNLMELVKRMRGNTCRYKWPWKPYVSYHLQCTCSCKFYHWWTGIQATENWYSSFQQQHLQSALNLGVIWCCYL